MRIAEGQLRKIIREELSRIDEMPYAGSLDPVDSGTDAPSFVSSIDDTSTMNKPGAERFAKSGRFKTLAAKHLAHIPYNVWIAPMIGVGAGVYDYIDDTRARIEPLGTKGIETLRSYGFKVPESLSPNDVVILYTTSSTVKDNLATPWMIFHAMLDNQNDTYAISPSYGTLRDSLIYEGGEIDGLELIGGEDNNVWYPALTMASARNGVIQGPSDALAEVVCQELLTTRGFVFNPDAVDPEVAEALKILQTHVKRVAEEFRRNIKGKLIVVAVN